jgi:hypothetical protein
MSKSYSKYDNAAFYDCSGSTGFGDPDFYHLKTQQIVKPLNSANTLFVRWDDSAKEISKVDLEEINRTKRGYGGTDPNQAIDFLKKINFKGNLIFICDGQISESIVRTCSQKLSEWKFNSVKIYLIYTGGIINESVSCAFTRNSPHTIEIYKQGSVEPSITNVSEDDIKLTLNIDSINSVDEFMRNVETFKNVITSINMGTSGNKTLHAKLVGLKNKLTKIESKSQMDKDGPVSRLVSTFNDNNPSIRELDDVWKLYYHLGENWITHVDKFISWCNGGLEKTFDREAISASNREMKAIEVPVVPSDSVQILEEKIGDLKLSCPISLDESTNVIILMKRNGISVFDNLPVHMRDSLINCPLNALRNNDILSYMRTLMDNDISIESYKELVDNGISDRSPLTREEIFGGLCLGKDKSHVDATNSTIRHILTGGKSLGNIDLWFAVLYLMIERGYANHLNHCLPMMREHMKYRMLNNKSYMCLSGLPTYPTYSVPLGLAMWTSIMATSSTLDLIKEPKYDPMRLHLSYSLDIIELLNLLDIKTVPSKLLIHIDRLKTFRHFLLEVKKGKEQKEKLSNLIDALFYNAIETSDLWVLIDGSPSDVQIEKVRNKLPSVCKDLSSTEIKDIFSLCDSNKSESDIYIAYLYQIKPYVKSYTKNWSFGMDVPYFPVKICPETCRPYYNIIDNGIKKTWLDKAIEIYGYDLFSTNNFFGNYISANEKYPTKDEFMNYLYRYHSSRDKSTLPICIQQFVDEVFNEYAEIIENIDARRFKELWDKSVWKDVRKSMEK